MATKIVNNAALSANLENDGPTSCLQFPDEVFPADEEIQQENVMPWRELPQNTWLRITQEQDVKLERGIVKILNLLQRDGTTFKVWSTAIISKDIDIIKKKREEEVKLRELSPAELYVKHLGMKASKTNPSRSYFNTKLMYF